MAFLSRLRAARLPSLETASTTFKSIANIFLRSLGILGRFILSLYIAKYIGLSSLGGFGLAQGFAAALPAILGLGINYINIRSIIGKDRVTQAAWTRDRLIVSLASFLVFSAIYMTFKGHFYFDFGGNSFLICAIFLMELISFDIHLHLTAINESVIANFLLLIRSSLWVFPIILLGFFSPALRTLNLIYIGWFIGLTCNFLVLAFFLRSWPLRQIFSTPVAYSRLGVAARQGLAIYVSDVSLVGQTYLDRFLIDFFLGQTLTGIYTFCFSLANAAHTLVYTGLVQVEFPRIIQKANEDDTLSYLKSFMLRFISKVFLVATSIAGAIYVISIVVFPYFGISTAHENALFFAVLLIGTVFRVTSDGVNYGLYSLKLDKSYVVINLFGVTCSVAMNVILIPRLGLIGAAVSLAITSTILFGARGFIMMSEQKRRQSLARRTRPNPSTQIVP